MRTDDDLSHARLERARARATAAGLVSKGLFAMVAFGVLAGAVYVFMPSSTRIQAPAAPEFPAQVTSYKSEIKGSDSKDLPYTINAEKSVQDGADRDVVHLETVGGVFERQEGKTYNVTSEKALYDRDTRQLVLEGKVKISSLPRMEAFMDKAEVDTVKRSLVSKSPVEVKLENGHVTADELRADNNGERLLFRGRVKAKFNN